MRWTLKRRYVKRVSLATFKLLLFTSFMIFIIFPLIYKFSYRLQRSIVFLNFVNIPPNPDYKNLTKFGLDGSRNFYLTSDDGIKLGVWQILPENITNLSLIKTEIDFENILNDGQNIIIYNHGNAGSRATPHRVELYKILRKYFHVIAYDYRSYGDSSDVIPSESNVVADCMFILNWVSNKTTTGNIFMWGHSLGTSISLHTLALLQKPTNLLPIGLILESPFNNFREEISEFPLAKYFKHLPWFSYTVTDPMGANNFKFESDKYILNVDIPIIILHAEDDNVVPFKLGHKLYQSGIKFRKDNQGSIKLIKFDSKFKYGHKYICRAPELEEIIRKFINESIQETVLKKINS